VLILETRKPIRISATKSYALRDPLRKQRFYLSSRDSLQISPGKKSIVARMGRKVLGYFRLLNLEMRNPRGFLRINGRGYRGKVWIRNKDRRTLQVINQVSVEDYLKGVVPLEMGVRSFRVLEALKAQAIIARTYALYRIRHPRDKRYHLLADTRDQVYEGVSRETRVTDVAVESTMGEVVIHADSLIEAFYHSTCGGHTEPMEHVWPGKSRPYLQGIADNLGSGDFCQFSPYYRWMEIWSRDELETIIKKYGKYAPIKPRRRRGRLKDIRILDRYLSGRVKRLQLVFERQRISLEGDRIRWVLRRTNGKLLPSTLFAIRRLRDRQGRLLALVALGAGYGHGVGFCQWGAIGMALQDFSYRDIIQHYFIGTNVRKLY